MNSFQLDTDNYFFLKQEGNFKYQHKYLVKGSTNDKSQLGEVEKWGKWTDLDARRYAKKHNVSILQTRKKPVKS